MLAAPLGCEGNWPRLCYASVQIRSRQPTANPAANTVEVKFTRSFPIHPRRSTVAPSKLSKNNPQTPAPSAIAAIRMLSRKRPHPHSSHQRSRHNSRTRSHQRHSPIRSRLNPPQSQQHHRLPTKRLPNLRRNRIRRRLHQRRKAHHHHRGIHPRRVVSTSTTGLPLITRTCPTMRRSTPPPQDSQSPAQRFVPALFRESCLGLSASSRSRRKKGKHEQKHQEEQVRIARTAYQRMQVPQSRTKQIIPPNTAPAGVAARNPSTRSAKATLITTISTSAVQRPYPSCATAVNMPQKRRETLKHQQRPHHPHQHPRLQPVPRLRNRLPPPRISLDPLYFLAHRPSSSVAVIYNQP